MGSQQSCIREVTREFTTERPRAELAGKVAEGLQGVKSIFGRDLLPLFESSLWCPERGLLRLWLLLKTERFMLQEVQRKCRLTRDACCCDRTERIGIRADVAKVSLSGAPH